MFRSPYDIGMAAPAPSRGVAVPLAAALLGFLVVLAASQREAPARSARRLELVDLIREQDGRVLSIQGDVRRLRGRLSALSRGAGKASATVLGLRRRAAELATLTGGTRLTGAGVVVTLDDSSAKRSPTGDPNDLVVHERDIQTVVNALWGSGAEAVSLNGQRLTALSAIRCAGNTLLLHGSVQSPPYRIAAIGDPESLRTSLPSQPGMDRVLAAARTFGLGFVVDAAPVRISSETPTASLRQAVPA